jgi:hypothetical protein
MSDDAMARIARDLADALRDFAHDRRPEDRQQVALLQTALCRARRAELKVQTSAVEEKNDEHSDP